MSQSEALGLVPVYRPLAVYGLLLCLQACLLSTPTLAAARRLLACPKRMVKMGVLIAAHDSL